MKRFCLILMFGALTWQMCSAQRVEVYYADIVYYIVPLPTYLLHEDCPPNNHITITEPSFLKYIDSICVNTLPEPDTTNTVSQVVPGMIQIIYLKSPKKYYTINMSHSLGKKTIKGFLEIDGELKTFSYSFQEVMDEIVNYHLHFPDKKINSESFLTEIINGKRRHLGYPIPKPWED